MGISPPTPRQLRIGALVALVATLMFLWFKWLLQAAGMTRQVILLAGVVAVVLLALVRRGRMTVHPAASGDLPARLTPSRQSPLLSDEYRGDVGGFENRAKTLDALRPENRQAFLALANAEMFTAAGIGAVNRLSRHVAAFRSLLADPGCDAAFKELVVIAGTSGQLYGLAGTYFTDPAFFRQAIVGYRSSIAPVIFFNGCLYGDQTVGAVAELIENGGLPRSFRGQGNAASSNDPAFYDASAVEPRD